jgi:uncharacterized protein YndB with AHSA1/START domain
MGSDAVPPSDGTGFQRTIRLARRLDASPERVARAWADPEELARWLPERVEGALAEGASTTLVWSDRRISWEVIESRIGSVFTFRCSWLPDDPLVTTVRVTFEPVGYGTWLVLEDGPFGLDQPGAIDAWAAALQEWTLALAQLRAQLDFSVDIRTGP